MSSVVPQSHTATDQWQSFELRMRRRRIERCVLRAGAALEAGVLDEAKIAIEEAAGLDPYDEAVKALAARIDAAALLPGAVQAEIAAEFPVEEAVEEVSTAGSRSWLALAATLILLSGSAGWFWARTSRAASQTPAAPAAMRTAIPAAANPQPGPAPLVPTDSVESPATPSLGVPTGSNSDQVAGTVIASTRPAPTSTLALSLPAIATGPIPPAAQQSAAESSDLPVVTLPAARGADARVEVAVAPAPTSATQLQPAPVLPDLAVPSPPALPAVESSALGAPVGEAVSASSAPVPPATSAASDERAVRAALGRYEAAYTRLDAAAAGQVWPSVDRRALARAFDGLESQTVSLGRCEVRVEGTSARAECTGSARWTPKVGGGAQTAPRRWRFDLRNASGDWIITAAAVGR
jgi:hypothetical protein